MLVLFQAADRGYILNSPCDQHGKWLGYTTLQRSLANLYKLYILMTSFIHSLPSISCDVMQAIGSVIRLQPTGQGQGQSQGEVQPLDVTGDSARRVTRHYRLWNDCSKHYVQVKDAKVNALGQANSPFGKSHVLNSVSGLLLLVIVSTTSSL